MKNFKKLGSILLAAAMCMSLAVPAFAADITADNSTGTVPVVVTTDASGDLTFKVTLPTSFDIAVDSNGAVTTTSGKKVTNASAGAVDIKNVEVTAANGWSLADFDDNFGKYGVGQKVIGMKLNNCKTTTTGLAFTAAEFKNDQSEAYMWAGIGNGIAVPEHNIIDLTYDAKLPGQNVAVSDTVANVVFTAGWHV